MRDQVSDDAAVVVRAVTKSFGAVRVLNGIDLRVPAGTVTAVLGPSGGGKTTLLRIIAGFEQPDAGSVTIAGSVVVSPRGTVPPERRRVGMVPQEGALFPHLSVGGNVAFGLRRGPRGRARVAEVLELVGLPGSERMRPQQLSGGQQHRVALARALAPHPSLVVLDEPFSSLDAGLRAQVRAEVLEVLRASNATALVVTHDQQEALSVADQVAVMLDGHIAQAADPVTLYERPASVEVATFVGDAVVLPATFDGRVARCALGAVETHPDVSVPSGAVTVVLRPEQLVLRRAAAGRRFGCADATVAATVTSRAFYGHDAVISVRLADATALSVRVHTHDLPPVGERVDLEVHGRASMFATGRT